MNLPKLLERYIAEVAAAASLENKDKGAYDGRSPLSYDETPYDTKSKQMISTIDEAPHLKQKRQKRDDYENLRVSDAREALLYHPFPNESVLQLYGTLA
ncbi:hypothetical protein M8J77_011534 [Diaphorina citri]|nr:hypothetical protein M8J77_011534 [Diaphorina citri]